MWDEIINPFPDVNGCTVELQECIRTFCHTLCNWCNFLSMLRFKLNIVNRGVSCCPRSHENYPMIRMQRVPHFILWLRWHIKGTSVQNPSCNNKDSYPTIYKVNVCCLHLNKLENTYTISTCRFDDLYKKIFCRQAVYGVSSYHK